MNLCRSCGNDFASVSAFDAHRTGKHAYTQSEGLALMPPREDGRRCLAPSEMLAAGWETDSRDRWVHPHALRNRPRNGAYPVRARSRTVVSTQGTPVFSQSD